MRLLVTSAGLLRGGGRLRGLWHQHPFGQRLHGRHGPDLAVARGPGTRSGSSSRTACGDSCRFACHRELQRRREGVRSRRRQIIDDAAKLSRPRISRRASSRRRVAPPRGWNTAGPGVACGQLVEPPRLRARVSEGGTGPSTSSSRASTSTSPTERGGARIAVVPPHAEPIELTWLGGPRSRSSARTTNLDAVEEACAPRGSARRRSSGASTSSRTRRCAGTSTLCAATSRRWCAASDRRRLPRRLLARAAVGAGAALPLRSTTAAPRAVTKRARLTDMRTGAVSRRSARDHLARPDSDPRAHRSARHRVLERAPDRSALGARRDPRPLALVREPPPFAERCARACAPLSITDDWESRGAASESSPRRRASSPSPCCARSGSKPARSSFPTGRSAPSSSRCSRRGQGRGRRLGSASPAASDCSRTR